MKAHILKKHSEPFGTAGLYTQLYVSIIVSFLHNVESLGKSPLHADIWRHVAAAKGVAAVDAALAVSDLHGMDVESVALA